MAPPTRRWKEAHAAAPPAPMLNPADRISWLPEEVQAQILSFLPAQEAVQTCVLARTWRHVWRFTRRLLITGKCVEEVREFVDHLLYVRRNGLELASLDAGEIRFNPFEKAEDVMVAFPIWEDINSINGWIDQVLKCEIQTLRVDISTGGHLCFCLVMGTAPLLVALHLTRTPMLERMPKLVRAKLRIDSFMDECNCDDPMACYHVTRDGDTYDTDSDSDDHEEVSKCVVLERFSTC